MRARTGPALRVLGLVVAIAATGCAGSASPSAIPSAAAVSPPPSGGTAASLAASPAASAPASASEAAVTTSPPPSFSPAGPFTLTSSAFHAGGAIPSRYTCDGADASPPLAWTGVPAGAKALALVLTDPDARGFVHWTAWDIDPARDGLPERASGGSGLTEGRNSFGRTGYGGPCPPSGSHHYVFELTALDARLGLGRGADADAVRRAVREHALATARLTGTYARH